MNIVIKESKKNESIEACEKVINGIENDSISVLSALLQCKKIARLLNDCDGMEWLEYEYGGYVLDDSGHVTERGWQLAAGHGRQFVEKDSNGVYQKYIFLDLCSELEASIESNNKAINNYSTQGISVAGEYAGLAANNIISSVNKNTTHLLKNIKTAEKKLSILKSQYYNFALKWLIELRFGNAAKTIFEEYQDIVDKYYNSLPSATIQKLKAIESLFEQEDQERYSQVLTSCRRLWVDTAKLLFDEVLPGYKNQFFTTRSGKEIDVTGDHVNNKLSAVIETLQGKSTKNILVGTNMLYLIDWLERINELQSSGVHSEITRSEAMQCIIHTYIALGDILNLKNQHN